LEGITGDSKKAKASLEMARTASAYRGGEPQILLAKGLIAEGAGLAQEAIRYFAQIPAEKEAAAYFGVNRLYPMAQARIERLRKAGAQTPPR
jgi:hypothetical protein